MLQAKFNLTVKTACKFVHLFRGIAVTNTSTLMSNCRYRIYFRHLTIICCSKSIQYFKGLSDTMVGISSGNKHLLHFVFFVVWEKSGKTDAMSCQYYKEESPVHFVWNWHKTRSTDPSNLFRCDIVVYKIVKAFFGLMLC